MENKARMDSHFLTIRTILEKVQEMLKTSYKRETESFPCRTMTKYEKKNPQMLDKR